MIVSRVEKHILKLNNEYYSMLDDFCYKAKNLFKDVNYIEPAVEGFDDAVVGDSLTIAILEKDAAIAAQLNK